MPRTKQHELTTPRLILVPITASDAVDLFPIYNHAEAMRHWHTPPHAQVTQTRTMIETMVQGRSCYWTIRLKSTAQAIGVTGFLGNQGVPGMGYILHPAHWGHGYMSEAVQAALDFGFGELGFDRVELWITADNQRSRRLAERLGFTYRGRFRQHYPHQASSHEKAVYGLRAEEWRGAAGVDRKHHIYALQPILAVEDVQATAEFYRDQLDFSITFLYGDPPSHGAVFCGEWTPEGAHIQFSRSDKPVGPTPSTALYLTVGPEINELYRRYQARNLPIVRELATYPWGMREFAVKDCNGYVLRFGTPESLRPRELDR